MFSRAKTREEMRIDSEISRLLTAMESITPGSKEYATMMDQMITLRKTREEEKAPSVNKDMLTIVGANLLGILMIINYEHIGNVITSRAFNLLLKPR